jgi:hypothetical protein
MTDDLKAFLFAIRNSSHPPSGKMTVREVVPDTDPKEYKTSIVHDPDATPWEIVDGVAFRCVGHGVNK